MTGVSSAKTIKALMHWLSDCLTIFATASTLEAPGVETSCDFSDVALEALEEGGGSSARSTLAAYPQSELTIPSSPDSARTINSCEKLPPIAPDSASTGRKVRPQRV